MPIFTGGLALLGGVLGGASQIGGDLIASGGQAAANEQNMQIAQKQMDFQAQQMQKAEDYDTQMSNTAVQRRVADMQAAGINPILAAGNPASSPMISSGQGASIAMQNPNASFSNLGGQLAGSVQAATNASSAVAQNNVANAQADNIRMDTATQAAKLPYSGQSAYQNLVNAHEQENVLIGQVNNLNEQFNLTRANAAAVTQSKDFQAQLQPILQQMQTVNLERLKAGLPGLENDANFQRSVLGQLAPYISFGTSAVGNVVGVGNKVKALNAPTFQPRGSVNIDTGETTPPY